MKVQQKLGNGLLYNSEKYEADEDRSYFTIYLPINKDFIEANTTHSTTKEDEITLKTTQEIDKTTQENIINIINKKPQITLQEIAIILKITRDGVKYHMTKLQEKGIIKHVGSTKAGKWIIIED